MEYVGRGLRPCRRGDRHAVDDHAVAVDRPGPRYRLPPARDADGERMIRIEDLHVRYQTERGEVYAVRGIDLDVKQGQFFTLLGPSGCGKTTTLRSRSEEHTSEL